MYLGNIVNGKASGLCVIVNQNHRYLTGFNDQRHTDTILFKGQIKNQHFENFCSLQTTSFGYCGDYKKGVRHGLGSLKYSNGSNYLGKFDNGSFHGFGYYKDTISNFQYWGQFHKGKKNGFGYIEGTFDLEKLLKKKNLQRVHSSVMKSKDFNGKEHIAYCGEWKQDIPHGKGILVKNGKEFMGEWLQGKRQGMFLVSKILPSGQAESQKKQFRSLIFKFRNDNRANEKGEKPNKAVIQRFDEIYKKYFPVVALKAFKKKVKLFKKTLKEEGKILDLKAQKMHQSHEKSQQTLKFKIRKLERKFMDQRETVKNISNHTFHLAKLSKSQNKKSKIAIKNIFEIKQEIAESEEQQMVDDTLKLYSTFQDLNGFNETLSKNNQSTEGKNKFLNIFMLSSLKLLEESVQVDRAAIINEVVSEMDESERLEFGRFDGKSSIKLEESN